MLKINYPAILHFPGSCKSGINSTLSQFWSNLLLQYNKPFVLKDTTIITWNNKSFKGIFETSLENLGIPYTVLGKEISVWQNNIKIALTLYALEKIKTEFVLGVDAFDALIISNPEKKLHMFNDCDLLFNATHTSFISLRKTDQLCDKNFVPSVFRYLNAGAWMGRVEFCKEFFSKTLTLEPLVKHAIALEGKSEKETNLYLNSEQFRIKMAFYDYFPRTSIDYTCSLFHLEYSNLDQKNYLP